MGYNAHGVEPDTLFVQAAQEYLGSTESVTIGTAEDIPKEDESQHLVLFESVLEHVDSPLNSLNEIYRVLAPGGTAVVNTTNRYKISPTGENGEYRIRFFNWLPDIVKECYVFHHLHYNPKLANYTTRPAVHWFSFADLCKLGWMAGFGQFYSFIDLVKEDDPSIGKSKFRSFIINKLKYNPWLRALSLTQLGSTIIMLKRQRL